MASLLEIVACPSVALARLCGNLGRLLKALAVYWRARYLRASLARDLARVRAKRDDDDPDALWEEKEYGR